MPFRMMRTAKPTNIQRLAIVAVVGLGEASTYLARFACKTPVTNRIACRNLRASLDRISFGILLMGSAHGSLS